MMSLPRSRVKKNVEPGNRLLGFAIRRGWEGFRYGPHVRKTGRPLSRLDNACAAAWRKAERMSRVIAFIKAMGEPYSYSR